MRYARNLAVLLNYRSQRSLIFTPNKRPRGTLIADQRRACAARPKGKNEESPGRSLLQTERFKFFLATGPTCKPRLPFSFKKLSRHTQVLCFFLDSRKKRIPSYPSFPLVPLPHFLVNIRWRILTTRAISGMLYMLRKC